MSAGRLFESLLRREISFFDREENAIGALTTRLSDDSRTVHRASGEAIAKQLQAFCTLCIGVGIGFSASWKLSLVVVSTFPITIGAAAMQMAAIAGQQNKDKGTGGRGNGGAVISSAFTSIRTVSAFSMQRKVPCVQEHQCRQ